MSDGVKFMVLGAPRSGTTWATNWLNQMGETVLHDPFMDLNMTPDVLDLMQYGISCTSSVIQHPLWVRGHICPKVVLHREFADINRSLDKLGLPLLAPGRWSNALWSIEANTLHVAWDDLFEFHAANRIFRHLTGRGMKDQGGYNALRDMNVQPGAGVIARCKDFLRVGAFHHGG